MHRVLSLGGLSLSPSHCLTFPWSRGIFQTQRNCGLESSKGLAQSHSAAMCRAGSPEAPAPPNPTQVSLPVPAPWEGHRCDLGL